ncbi:MAG: glycosyltransferase family A protein [Candidatus Omnitrophota bacterium]
MDFSIVVPVYNKEKTLEACINSLLAQDYTEGRYEIIFVNNNSTDNSCAIIGRRPSLKLIHEKKQGSYAGRNAGIRQAEGSVVVFTDADIEVRRDWLKNIRSAFAKNNYDILIGWCLPAVPVKLLEVHSLFIREKIKAALAQKDYRMLIAGAGNLAIKRSVFAAEGLFSADSNSDDTNFVIRCCEKGYKAGFSDDIEARRNDISGIGIYLLKNFISGCSYVPESTGKPSLAARLKNAGLLIKFMFRHFPVGLGMPVITLFYFMGNFLNRIGVIKPSIRQRLVLNYTNFMTKKGL